MFAVKSGGYGLAAAEETGNSYRVLARKLLGKRPLGRLTRYWEDNIKINIRLLGWEVGGTGLGLCPMACLGIAILNVRGCAGKVLIMCF